MTELPAATAVLACHPDAGARFVTGINARVIRLAPARLTVVFLLSGNMADLRIPPSAIARRTDRLWQHTCFEAFVSVDESPGYCEFNLSPSGEWAAYLFHRYRERSAVEYQGLNPNIAVRRTADSLKLEAELCLDVLPEIRPDAKLSLGFAAVVEDRRERLSYWALRHPPGKPDFHHRDGFILHVPLASQPR